MGMENVFHEIIERKTSFKDYKNSNSKKSKNWDFSKWNGFGQKFAVFHLFILGEIGLKYVF